MKRIVRLTESELTNVIKRIVKEQQAVAKPGVKPAAKPSVEKTQMQPIVVKELPLVNEPGGYTGLAVSSGTKPDGGVKYQDITVKGNYSFDPNKGGGVQDKNFVNVTISLAPKLYTYIKYDCANKKVLGIGGEVSGKLPSQSSQAILLKPKEGNTRNTQPTDPGNYGNVLYNKTKHISTTSGPVAEVIQYYCSAK